MHVACLVKIGKQRYRTLVDTGAECSLMYSRIYDQLKNKPRSPCRRCAVGFTIFSLLLKDLNFSLLFVVTAAGCCAVWRQ